MDDLADALPQIEPKDFEAREYIDPRKSKEHEKALGIANDSTLAEAEKIDRMAKHRRWFSADTSRINAYLASEISATDLAAEIAAPIDRAYSTADHGSMYYESERVARTQRKYHSLEKALEVWGPEETFEKPDEETKNTLGTEVQLWDLWYSILHAAKRIPWQDEGKQEKLLDLVKALKARPDPPVPEPMTIPLGKNWIWTQGEVWSVTLMLGPSARESWNDSCGCGAGWTTPETAAWTNVNAFVARMVASGVAGMFYLYGEWALSDLERKWSDQNDHQRSEDGVIHETIVTIAALWVIIAAKEIYERRERDGRGVDAYDIGIDKRGQNFPWIRGKHGVTRPRWIWWKRRFEQESEDDSLPQGVRDLVSKAAKLIQGFEGEIDSTSES